MSLFSELKRRNVFRVAVAYLVAAWLLTEVADTLFPLFGYGDMPARIVVILLAIGFPFAVIFSWAYEITPEGLKREKDVVREESVTHVTARRLDGITIGLIVLALAFITADRLWLSPGSPGKTSAPAEDTAELAGGEPDAGAEAEAEASIAVLPFVNMSDDPNNEYFSDGISEELLTLLSRAPELRVPARTSSFSFKGMNVTVREIAEKLAVQHVLEGSVRRVGDRVRITAQLIEARSDTQLWSETYDRRLDDIFTIQDEIAQTVAAKLLTSLLGQAALSRSGGTRDPQAYEFYLQGRHFWRRRNADDLLQAARLLERAVAIDPEYADAWSALAATYGVIPTYAELEEGPYLDDSVAAARTALNLDPTQAEAYAVLSNFHYLKNNSWFEAVRQIEKAIELDPQNATAHHWAYIIYISAGRLDEAHREIEKAYRLDPLSAAIAGSLGWSHSVAGNYEKAITMLKTAEELGWGDFATPYIALNHALKGDTKAAAGLYASLGATRDFVHFDWAPFFLEALENQKLADEFAERMLTMVDAGEANAVSVYPLLALLGSEMFRTCLADRNYIWALWYRDASAIRQTQTFRQLVNDIKLVDYWQESGRWPDLCSPSDDKSFACN